MYSTHHNDIQPTGPYGGCDGSRSERRRACADSGSCTSATSMAMCTASLDVEDVPARRAPQFVLCRHLPPTGCMPSTPTITRPNAPTVWQSPDSNGPDLDGGRNLRETIGTVGSPSTPGSTPSWHLCTSSPEPSTTPPGHPVTGPPTCTVDIATGAENRTRRPDARSAARYRTQQPAHHRPSIPAPAKRPALLLLNGVVYLAFGTFTAINGAVPR